MKHARAALLALACGLFLAACEEPAPVVAATEAAPPEPEPPPPTYAECKAEYERIYAEQVEETKAFAGMKLSRVPETYGDFVRLFGQPFKEDDNGQSKEFRAAHWFRTPMGTRNEAIALCVEGGELRFIVDDAVFSTFATRAPALKDGDLSGWMVLGGAFPGEIGGIRLGMSEADFQKRMAGVRQDDEGIYYTRGLELQARIEDGVVTTIIASNVR